MNRFLSISILSVLGAVFLYAVSGPFFAGLEPGAARTAARAAAAVIYFAASFLLFRALNGELFAVSGPRKADAAFIIVLAFAAAAPVAGMDHFTEVSVKENKILASFPNVNPFHEAFPKRADEYVNDRMGFRSAAREVYSRYASLFPAADLTGTHDALEGRDYWLFYNMRDTGETLEDFQRLERFSESELDILESYFRRTALWCEKRGIKLYVIMPPNKHDVYPEYYPEHIGRLDFPSKYGQLKRRLASGFPLVEIDEAVKEAKKGGEVFFKNDTHWNYRGGYAAYLKLTEAIRRDFPDLFVYSTEEIKEVSVPSPELGDLAMLLGIYNRVYGPALQPKPAHPVPVTVAEARAAPEDPNRKEILKVTPYPERPRAYVVRDSFYDYLEPFMTGSFSAVREVWTWAGTPAKFAEEIERDKPDIIIWEVQQRYLDWIARGDVKFPEGA